MKVSEWLRRYQITGAVPQEGDAMLAFWCGYLLGKNRVGQATGAEDLDDAKLIERRAAQDVAMAIKCAEYIESQVAA